MNDSSSPHLQWRYRKSVVCRVNLSQFKNNWIATNPDGCLDLPLDNLFNYQEIPHFMNANDEIRRNEDDRRDEEGRRELMDRRIAEAEKERNLREERLRRKQSDRRQIIERRDD